MTPFLYYCSGPVSVRMQLLHHSGTIPSLFSAGAELAQTNVDDCIEWITAICTLLFFLLFVLFSTNYSFFFPEEQGTCQSRAVGPPEKMPT